MCAYRFRYHRQDRIPREDLATRGTATGAASATAGAMRSTAETTTFPIAGYDEMNVEEISRGLNDLSVEQIRQLHDYEERHKRRETLLEQMDRKIRAT